MKWLKTPLKRLQRQRATDSSLGSERKNPRLLFRPASPIGFSPWPSGANLTLGARQAMSQRADSAVPKGARDWQREADTPDRRLGCRKSAESLRGSPQEGLEAAR
jgi:hypothetical protein